MKAVRPQNGAYGATSPAEPELPNGHVRMDTLRAWLVNGSHLVDPRRRFGHHGHARELLVVERPPKRGASEGWKSLASALQRHTIQSGLARLSPEERHVITLAYLQGRTNREIAGLLGLSVTTVRRRLALALQHLDDYISRTGAWLAAFLLAALIYATGHAARLGRFASTTAGSADRVQKLAATVAAGTLTAATLGVIAYSAHSATLSKSPHV